MRPVVAGRRWSALILGGAALLATGAARLAAPAAPSHFADASDRAAVLRGRVVYAAHCAACHGRYLQGQPLWQVADAASGRRAPPHDATGHTWMHADEALFQMTRSGRWAGGPATFMPGFAGVLDDRDILAVLAFIKARWPVGLRVLQALRNPGHLGMPSGAAGSDWRLPPGCTAAQARAGLRS